MSRPAKRVRAARALAYLPSRPSDFGLSTLVPRRNRFGTTSPEVDLFRILAMVPGILVIKRTKYVRRCSQYASKSYSCQAEGGNGCICCLRRANGARHFDTK